MRLVGRLAKLVPKTEVGAQKIFPRKITFVLTQQNTFVIIHPMPQRKRKTPKLSRLTHMAASRQGVEVAEAGTHRETAGTATAG